MEAAHDLAMKIFEVSKHFPTCLNLREAWAKRRYEAHFVSKLTDCDGENSETDSSLDFARDCQYITQEQHADLVALCREVGKMLGSMINNPRSFLISDL